MKIARFVTAASGTKGWSATKKRMQGKVSSIVEKYDQFHGPRPKSTSVIVEPMDEPTVSDEPTRRRVPFKYKKFGFHASTRCVGVERCKIPIT